MFFEPKNGHGLPHDPFRAIVAPRPIGWISSLDGKGHPNLAPYSFFNALGGKPPIVGFSSEGLKDSVQNVRETGEFVVNLATRPLSKQLNESSRPVDREVNEFELSGLTPVPCRVVKPPRVAESPAALECKVTEIVEIKGLDGASAERWLSIGEVVGIHVDERCLKDGLFDMVEAQTIARCGYWEYTQVTSIFQMDPPFVFDH